ncbi:MAG: hypothetical protein ACYDDF_10455 [Thermoplasmatota archaeon]
MNPSMTHSILVGLLCLVAAESGCMVHYKGTPDSPPMNTGDLLPFASQDRPGALDLTGWATVEPDGRNVSFHVAVTNREFPSIFFAGNREDCGGAWSTALTDPGGRRVTWQNPTFEICDGGPGMDQLQIVMPDHLDWNDSWNGTVWDGVTGGFVPAPAGRYVWSATLQSSDGRDRIFLPFTIGSGPFTGVSVNATWTVTNRSLQWSLTDANNGTYRWQVPSGFSGCPSQRSTEWTYQILGRDNETVPVAAPPSGALFYCTFNDGAGFTSSSFPPGRNETTAFSWNDQAPNGSALPPGPYRVVNAFHFGTQEDPLLYTMFANFSVTFASAPAICNPTANESCL